MTPIEFLQSLIAQQQPAQMQPFGLGGDAQGGPPALRPMAPDAAMGTNPFAALLQAIAPMGGGAAMGGAQGAGGNPMATTGLFPQIAALLGAPQGAQTQPAPGGPMATRPMGAAPAAPGGPTLGRPQPGAMGMGRMPSSGMGGGAGGVASSSAGGSTAPSMGAPPRLAETQPSPFAGSSAVGSKPSGGSPFGAAKQPFAL